MKVNIFIILLFVVLLVVATEARGRNKGPGGRCRGNPATPVCIGPRDEGTSRGRRCRRNAGARFYYDAATRSCLPMNYRGCGGNNNRWCTIQQCETTCRRP